MAELRKEVAEYEKNNNEKSTVDYDSNTRFIIERIRDLKEYNQEMLWVINARFIDSFVGQGWTIDADKIITGVEEFYAICRKLIRWKERFITANVGQKYNRLADELCAVVDEELLVVDELHKNLVDARKESIDLDKKIHVIGMKMKDFIAVLEDIISSNKELINKNSLITKRENPIEDLELRTRVYYCLKKAGINTVGDICYLTMTDLMKVRNLGRKGYDDIVRKLKDIGISLRE